MIGLIAYVFPKIILGEGNAQLRQLEKAFGGGSRLAKSGIAVDVGIMQIPGQFPHAVIRIPGQG